MNYVLIYSTHDEPEPKIAQGSLDEINRILAEEFGAGCITTQEIDEDEFHSVLYEIRDNQLLRKRNWDLRPRYEVVLK